MFRVQYGNWVPGGVIRIYSRRHHVWHYVIAGREVGTVMHGSKDRGYFALTTLDEAAEGQPGEYTWLPENFEAQEAALSRAESMLGRPFNLLNANCEDYVNWIITGVARSPQREQFAIAALILLVIVGLAASA